MGGAFHWTDQPVRTTAHLIPDGGAAAVSPDFFRCAPFLRAEAATHSLVLENDRGRSVLPLLVRTIPGTFMLDAISPYGYPGGRVDGDIPDHREADLAETGLVSVFVRDRLAIPSLVGGTCRGRVLLHDPSVPRRLSKTFRNRVRRNARSHFTVELLAGKEVDDECLHGFASAYTQTMALVGAAERYSFTMDYLRECFNFDQSWLAVVRDSSGEVAAADLAVTSDGMLHSYLAGTNSNYRTDSPHKNAIVRLMDLADDLGIPINFGGGFVAGDGVEASKRSTSNADAAFVTHELICEPERYAELSVGNPGTAYFPLYRARTDIERRGRRTPADEARNVPPLVSESSFSVID